MVDDDVLVPDRGEAVAAKIADALGKAGGEGREEQIGPLVQDELPDFAQGDQPVLRRTSRRSETREFRHQELPQVLGHVGIRPPD